MHTVDQAILDNTVSPELLRREAQKPLPPPGESYWGDAMRELAGKGYCDDLPLCAARQAERDMGIVVARMTRAVLR